MTATVSFQLVAGIIPAPLAPSSGPIVTTTVPAGPALVGFSMSVTGPFGDTTCGLFSLETTAPIAVAPPVAVSSTAVLIAVTQVVTLTAPTTLELECSNSVIAQFASFTNLSIYALSFATS